MLKNVPLRNYILPLRFICFKLQCGDCVLRFFVFPVVVRPGGGGFGGIHYYIYARETHRRFSFRVQRMWRGTGFSCVA